MKIYSKIVLDIATGVVRESEAINYLGPIVQLKGATKSTTTNVVSLPPASPDEIESRQLQKYALLENIGGGDKVVLTQAQFDALPEEQRLGNWTQPGGPSGGIYVRSKTDSEYSPDELNARKIDKLFSEEALKRAESGFGATPEEKQKLGVMFDEAKRRGNNNIREFLSELSGSRGMDVASSTPLAREASRATEELNLGIEGQRAASELNFAEGSRNFAQELRNFQQGLTTRAADNRMAAGAGFGNMANNMAQLRAQSASSTSKTKSSGGGGGFLGGLANFAGGFAGGFLRGGA